MEANALLLRLPDAKDWEASLKLTWKRNGLLCANVLLEDLREDVILK